MRRLLVQSGETGPMTSSTVDHQHEYYAKRERELSSTGNVHGIEAFILVTFVIGLLIVSIVTTSASVFLMMKLNLSPGREVISFDSNGRVFFNQDADLNRIHLSNANSEIKGIESISGNIVLQTLTSRLVIDDDDGVEIVAPNGFQIVSPETGRKIFPRDDVSTLSLPSSLSSLAISGGVKGVKKIRSPIDSDLDIRSESSIKIRGNQGVEMAGKKVSLTAGQHITISSINGSVVLDAAEGIFLKRLPTVGLVDNERPDAFPATMQYKLCVYGKSGRLFKLHMKTADTTCADVRFPESINPCL